MKDENLKYEPSGRHVCRNGDQSQESPLGRHVCRTSDQSKESPRGDMCVECDTQHQKSPLGRHMGRGRRYTQIECTEGIPMGDFRRREAL